MAALSAELETLYTSLYESNSQHERRTLQRQIDHDKAEIDSIVFELYRLSADDINLIQGNPLTFAAVAVAEPTTVGAS